MGNKTYQYPDPVVTDTPEEKRDRFLMNVRLTLGILALIAVFLGVCGGLFFAIRASLREQTIPCSDGAYTIFLSDIHKGEETVRVLNRAWYTNEPSVFVTADEVGAVDFEDVSCNNESVTFTALYSNGASRVFIARFDGSKPEEKK